MGLAERPADPILSEEDALRADLYDMVGALLARPPAKDLLSRVASLTGDGSQLGQSIQTLAHMSGMLKPEGIEAEFNTLFIGLTRGELM
ncbi:MAG: molecular chaperone TorD, partial [Paracoccaceae bacterium]